jgi:hypothetical protein
VERISGPWHGAFVGAYTTELHGLFYGYVKLFAEEPADLWVDQFVMKLGAGGYVTESEALDAAEQRGIAALAELHERRNHGLWERLVARVTGHCWSE